MNPMAPPEKTPLGTRIAMACLMLAGVAAVVGIGMVLNLWLRPTPLEPEDRLRLAFQEYVAGNYDVAERLIEPLQFDPEVQPELHLQHQFLRGATGIRLAAVASEPDLVRHQTAASLPFLQWSVQHEFPPGRAAEGQRLLGLGLTTLGRFADAIAPLSEALAQDPTMARELLLPLAEAKLRAAGEQSEGALTDVERLLGLPNLSPGQRDRAMLLKGRVQTALEQWSDADSTFQSLSDPGLTDPAIRESAQQGIAANWIAHAQSMIDPTAADGVPPAAQKLLDQAIAMLEEMDRRGDADRGAEARYLAGRALRIAGRSAEALELFSSLRKSRRQAAEAISAGVEEMELLSEAGRFSEVVEVAESIIREIGDPLTYDTKWLTMPVLQSRLKGVAGRLRLQGAFPESIELAAALVPVCDNAESLELQAAAHHQWGATMLESVAPRVAEEERRKTHNEAREHLRIAGEAYAKAAELHFLDPNYLELLWEAIQSSQAGRDFTRSLALLDDYLRYEARARKARGLIARGRALLALNQPEQAVEPLEQCLIEFPRDPLRYEARLLAAVSRLEMGDLEAGRKALEENLFDGLLAPSSPVYRDALFILGESLFRQAHREHLELTTPTLAMKQLEPGDRPSREIATRFMANQQIFEDAILRLDQAAHRDSTYENTSRARRAIYLAAEAHRMAAYWPSILAADPETLESARRLLNQKRASHLAAARGRYAELRQQLNAIDQRDELQTWELAMLRNSVLSEADMWFEMGNYEEAAAAYLDVSQRFMNEPIALEALLRQSQCYGRLGRDADAARVLEQSARMLQRIPAEEDLRFAETTRYGRENWTALLDWLQ